MTHASVFSGIGGPEVAASMLGWENLFHCEINPFGKKVLDYWYPNAESYDDITRTVFTKWRGRVDVFTGGFPCQPFSYAGRRRGAEDYRYLWPSMYRAIDEIQPTWVVAENVAGILTMVEQGEVSKVASPASLFAEINDVRGQYQLRETFTLQRICTDLEGHGYAVQPILIPACAVGAPHRRDRVFIVARRIVPIDTNDIRHTDEREIRRGQNPEPCGVCEDGIRQSDALSDTASIRQCGDDRDDRQKLQGGNGWQHIPQSDDEWRLRAWIRQTCEPRTSPHPDSQRGSEVHEHLEPELADGAKPLSNGGQRNVADTDSEGRNRWCPQGRWEDETYRRQGLSAIFGFAEGHHDYEVGDRWHNFPSVSPVHRGNDGLPFDVDRLTISFGKWRTEALKAYGNAIVPQVMYEIFRAIEQVESDHE